MTRGLILSETKILLLICLMDLVVTTWLYITAGYNPLVERNLLMRYFLVSGGLGMFFFAKAAMTLPALVVLEWYRTKNPDYSVYMLRLAIVCYLVIFFGGIGLSFR